MDQGTITYWLTWVGTGAWVICFWWMHRISTPQVCDILFLDIGPIFLEVLGLEVDLSEIVLDINAVAGPGNLLGNLLCALVGLLD